MWCLRQIQKRVLRRVSLLWHLICCSVMAGELTLPVVLGTLLGVGVEDDAVSGAGDDLLTICVGHELCAEDVCPMTWAYWVFDLQKKSGIPHDSCLDGRARGGHYFLPPTFLLYGLLMTRKVSSDPERMYSPVSFQQIVLTCRIWSQMGFSCQECVILNWSHKTSLRSTQLKLYHDKLDITTSSKSAVMKYFQAGGG